MKNQFANLVYAFAFILLLSCSSNKPSHTITVNNPSEFPLTNENVEVSISDLSDISDADFLLLVVTEEASQKVLLSQHIDTDGDGFFDKILFQVNLDPGATGVYKLSKQEPKDSLESKVFSRFVPERTDDYAWENDRVAFRTYGQVAQKMKEEGTPGGTLSSGIDCWLKKVDYPIIDKWYEKHTTGAGSYHEDTGEGFDPYHVGSSRGCGGIGYWANNQLYTSKNFTAYETLENGPIRTSFTLDYEDWVANGKLVKEQKLISLDLGKNLSHVQVNIQGIDTVTIGITLHENKGQTFVDTVNCFFSYWEPMKDSELGTGIVIDPKYYIGYTKFISEEADQSQLLIHVKVIDGKIDYYTGFGWKESGQFLTSEEWVAFLKKKARDLTNSH